MAEHDKAPVIPLGPWDRAKGELLVHHELWPGLMAQLASCGWTANYQPDDDLWVSARQLEDEPASPAELPSDRVVGVVLLVAPVWSQTLPWLAKKGFTVAAVPDTRPVRYVPVPSRRGPRRSRRQELWQALARRWW